MMTQGCPNDADLSQLMLAPTRGELQMHVKLLEHVWAMRFDRTVVVARVRDVETVRSRQTHSHCERQDTVRELQKARKAVGAGPFTTLPDVSYCDP
jgi:hypothetical protein